MIKKITSLKIVDKPLSWYDWIIFFGLAVICVLSFMQYDIVSTGVSSFAILNGHILDYYEYILNYTANNAYLISTYILFAIWNLPLKLMSLILPLTTLAASFQTIMWFKLLPCLLYLISAIIIFKISKIIGMGNQKSKLCAYVFLTTPIAFFSQFIFTQYDIFTLIFMLLGVYFYLKKDMWKFVVFFGIATTFKYFAFLFFIPLLLLREKRYSKIFLYCAGFLLPLALVILPYVGYNAFSVGPASFNPTSFIFATGFNIKGPTNFSLVIVGFVFCSAWSFFTNPIDKDDEVKWIFFFTTIVVFLCFGLSFWHPQWLLLSVPFLVFGTFINKKPSVFLILDIVLMFFFVVFTINIWPGHLDHELLIRGLLHQITGEVYWYWPVKMRDIILFNDVSLSYSIMSAILLVNVIFKHPKFCAEKLTDKINLLWNLIRMRFIIGVSIFIIPAAICLVALLILPYPFFALPLHDLTPTGPISSDNKVVQVITLEEEKTLSGIEIMFGTYARINSSFLNLSVEDYYTGYVYYSTSINARNIRDTQFNRIMLPDIPLEAGREYALVFSSNETDVHNTVTIWAGTYGGTLNNTHVEINGKKIYDISSLNIYLLGK